MGMLLAFGLHGYAQDDDTALEEAADEIRLDEDYIYSELFFPDSPDVDLMMKEDQALGDLTSTVNDLRKAAKKRRLNKSHLHPMVKYMNYRSGRRRCVFVYLPVEKAMKFEPSAADHVEDNPMMVHPDGGSDGGSDDVAIYPIYQEVVEVVEVMDGEYADTVAVDPVDVGPICIGSLGGQGLVADILGRPGIMLGELGKLVQLYRDNGQIEAFGQVRANQEIPEDAFLVIVNRSLKATNILGPMDDGQWHDLVSGDPVDPRSFHDFGMVWFK